MTDLLLPVGDRPEILRPGCRVAVQRYPEAVRQFGVVAYEHVAFEAGTFWQPPQGAAVSLDLTHRESRNRAVEWLAEQHGVLVFTSCSPAWMIADPQTRPWWLLSGLKVGAEYIPICFLATDKAAAKTLRERGKGPVIVVPALGDLDPADPRLLEDGSRWVDARALVLCCLAAPARVS